jgi:hypothetical protein
MIEIQQQGWDYLRRQLPDLAFSKYESGLNLALQDNDPCWELFFRFWQLETRTYYQVRYPEALRIGIQATTLAHKPTYEISINVFVSYRLPVCRPNGTKPCFCNSKSQRFKETFAIFR